MNRLERISGLCFILAVALFIVVFSALLIPPRESHGANWGSFLKEEKNSVELMFFGSSLVYCDVMPQVITTATGYSSYVLAGPEQTIEMTYYYLKEAFRSQSPAMVFIEVTGMFYPQYTDYTKVNIGYMPWTKTRFEATLCAAEKEEWPGLFFPLYNYHERWPSLFRGNVSTGYQLDELRGYTPLEEARVIRKIIIREVDFQGELYAKRLSYLRKIAGLCEEKGSIPLFFIAPSCARWEEEYLAKLKNDLAGIEKALFYDFNEALPPLEKAQPSDFNGDRAVLPIDYETDFYDFLHFNSRGAEKFSLYLSQLIADFSFPQKP